MKTLEQLRQYYDTDLKRHLEAFEQERQRFVTKSLVVFGILAVVGVGGGLFLMAQGIPPPILMFILIGCVIIGYLLSFCNNGISKRL